VCGRWPSWLQHHELEIYLARRRPLLLGAGRDDHLWVTLDGSPVRAEVIYK